jgi:hypothetical protein
MSWGVGDYDADGSHRCDGVSDGALLAQALAENSDPVAAFSASKPGQGQNYLLFHSGHDERAETKNDFDAQRVGQQVV